MTEINGEIEIPYSLFKSIELDSVQTVPLKYLISHASYSCICKDSLVSVECEYQIRIFDNVSGGNSNNKQNLSTLARGGSGGNQSSVKESIQLVSQKATILNSTIKYSKNGGINENTWTSGENIGATILTSGTYYYLHSGLPGRYNVKLELSVPYLTVKEAGMDLSIPKCSNNSVFFRVPHTNANIKIFNSFLDTKSLLDWNDKHSKESNNYTVTFVKLANELSLKAQWTINEDFISNKISINNNNNNTTSVPKVNIKPNVIVSQSILCSIGEGLLLLKCQFDYKIIAGVISSFNIEIQDDINIVNVEGLAMKGWEILELEKPESPNHKRVVQIQLDYGFDSSYSIFLTGEYTMKDTSGELSIPSFFCKGEISRQRGYLGVEARTNVEISDIGNQGLSFVDVRELPNELSKLANHPILLSYKFLEPDYRLMLKVKRNMDCAVLVSICEEAHFITTVSYSGKMIHQLILNIKNTQQQFLRIRIPYEFEVYSTSMDSEPIRPSFSESDLLIPILKPGIFDQNTPIKIEIVLLQKSLHHFDSKSKKGRFSFVIPKIDLPLRAAFSTVYLPPGTIASNFTGILKNVSYFSSTPPSASSPTETNAIATPRPRGWGARNDSVSDFSNYQQTEQMKSNKLKVGSFASKNSSYGGGGNNKRRGVVPVFVEIPQTTQPYYFEQILLSGDKDLTFEFTYKSVGKKVKRYN